MNIFKLAGLGLKLQSIWGSISKSNPITPTKIVNTMKIVYQFFGGALLAGGIFAGLLYFDPCGPTQQPVQAKPYSLLPEPTQVLPDAATEPAPPKAPERSVLKTIKSNLGPAPYDVRIIVNEFGNATDKGSGTLYRPDAVVTAYHVIRDQPNKPITILLSNGNRVVARFFQAEPAVDIAVLTLDYPVDLQPAKLSTTKDLTHLECHGYGQTGTFKIFEGKFQTWGAIDKNKNYSTANIGVGVRDGDSGGGIFNNDGLYGVIWGSRDGVTRGTSGEGFRCTMARINKNLDDRPDKLVVHSMDLKICAPCRLMADVVKQLNAAGYAAEDIIDENPDGSRPVLYFYKGEKLVASHAGALEYNVVAGSMLRKHTEPCEPPYVTTHQSGSN